MMKSVLDADDSEVPMIVVVIRSSRELEVARREVCLPRTPRGRCTQRYGRDKVIPIAAQLSAARKSFVICNQLIYVVVKHCQDRLNICRAQSIGVNLTSWGVSHIRIKVNASIELNRVLANKATYLGRVVSGAQI